MRAGNQFKYRKGAFARLLGLVVALGLLSGCYTEYRDSNVQAFGPGEAAVLDGKQLYFTFYRDSYLDAVARGDSKLTPIWGLPPYYYRAVSERREFLVNPSAHESIDFSESDPFLIPGSEQIGFPSNYSGVYVGSSGTIAYQAPGNGNGDFSQFFSTRQISVLPIDSTVSGARVSYGVLPNMLVVTFENVAGSSVQCIKVNGLVDDPQFPGIGSRYSDDIIITYREIGESTRAGVVGISWGFFSSDVVSDAEHLAVLDEQYGGEANLLESTNTSSGGYLNCVPLP